MDYRRQAVTLILAFFLVSVGINSVAARNQLRIVGSSTVYPFTSYVAEEFGAMTEHPTPIVESTGTGGGMKLFCAGVGLDSPDITNASRRMQPDEFKRCQKNGVTRITEAMFGYDGVVLSQNVANPELHLTREQITRAVAAEVPQDGKLIDNPYTYWDDIHPDLPHREILIYGPPTTSGTRDAFEELVMEAASQKMAGYSGKYTKIRQDGAYVPAGENDNLIVQKLVRNRTALGIFGYSFLKENTDRIQPVIVGGVVPTPQTISSGEYPISRSLFFYVKDAHLDALPSMKGYVELFLSEKMIGKLGYLKRLGLIPLLREERQAVREQVGQWDNLQLSALQ